MGSRKEFAMCGERTDIFLSGSLELPSHDLNCIFFPTCKPSCCSNWCLQHAGGYDDKWGTMEINKREGQPGLVLWRNLQIKNVDGRRRGVLGLTQVLKALLVKLRLWLYAGSEFPAWSIFPVLSWCSKHWARSYLVFQKVRNYLMEVRRAGLCSPEEDASLFLSQGVSWVLAASCGKPFWFCRDILA